LFEKADTVGGTSAWSGGTVWLPNNRHEVELGFSDSREEVLTCLMSLSHGLMEQPLVEAYVDTAPEVVAWLEDHSPVEFETLRGMSDYHPEHPGGKQEGRSLECTLFPFADLGDWAHRVTVGWQITGEITMSESSLGRKAPGGVPAEELERRKLRDERGAGQALVGRLLRGCLDRGVEPQVGSRGVRLLPGAGRVTGVLIEGPDGPFEAHARGGVVLATGGFEHDERLVKAFLRGPLARAVSVPTNTDDGLRMAMRVGADLTDMREAWWVATIDVDVAGWGRVPWQVNTERTRPHTIMVNDDGVRFTNEAANYNALGNAFHVVDVQRFAYVNHPAWLVLDHHFLSRYGLAGHRPPAPTPGWMIEAPTVTGLAERMGVPADAMRATVERWNGNAAAGSDPDFRRGDSHHDRAWGDPAFGGTHLGTLGPIDCPSYYAVRVRCGALGTKGGPRTDTQGRVLDVDGDVIEGLYAAGNAMGSVMGMTYGGHGGTLGPGLVFGYLSGRHAAALATPPMTCMTVPWRLAEQFADTRDDLTAVQLDIGHELVLRQARHAVLQVEPGGIEGAEVRGDLLRDGFG
jgi:succinate dehydrogenase/fumarate reductase flavoprotein subunit